MRHDAVQTAAVGAMAIAIVGCFQTRTLLDEDGGTADGAVDGGVDGALLSACEGIDPEVFLRDTCGLSGCHSPGSFVIDLASPGVSDRLRSQTASCGERSFVGMNSFLLEKIQSRSPECGSPMPLVGGPLSVTEVDCIEAFIRSIELDGRTPTGGGNDAGISDGGACSPMTRFTEADWLLTEAEADALGLVGSACTSCHQDVAGQYALFPSCRPSNPPGIAPSVPTPSHPFFRDLRCDMDLDTAIRSVVRSVACDNDPAASVSQLASAWAAGLFGTYDLSIGGSVPGLAPRGCAAWRCLAEASTCGEARRCDEEETIPGPCTSGAVSCAGSVLHVCNGTAFTETIDCASVGAECDAAGGGCVTSDGCAFGPSDPPTCAGGDVALCPTLELSCLEWDEDNVCAPVTTGAGSFPTCAPSSTPVELDPELECRNGLILIRTGRASDVFDCVGAGYSGCNERGCTP